MDTHPLDTPPAHPPTGEAEELVALAPLRVAGQELTVFLESPPLVESLLADIRAAQSRVWIESYMIVADHVGQAIGAALAEQARHGLDVRVLYDALGSQGTPGSYFQTLVQAGAQVHAFHSLWEGLRRFAFFRLLNRRNHRKLIVIDDQIGYFGGMNIIDPRDPSEPEPSVARPVTIGWRDVHFRLVGRQQAELADSFLRSWRRAQHQHVPRRSRTYRRARLAASYESLRFYDSGPGLRYSRAARVFARVFRRARQRIVISMAYFLPTGRVLASLLRARRRGVAVEIVVPSRSDVRIVEMATRHLLPRLGKRGFRVYERQRRMLHSKLAVIDGEWTVTGSANLDARSLGYNLEFVAVIRSRPLAEALERVCAYEIAHSRPVDPEHLARRSRMQQFLGWCAYSLRWWL